jgi:hypothetical protein
MANKQIKTEKIRLPKGQRTHIRRMKQAAGKEANINNPQSSPVKRVRVHKKQEQS